MSSFGEDLRAARISRGIALEKITEVTKISQRHLVALEQEKFGQLPGGILGKGIVRGYADVVGLDQRDWTDRFLAACTASGETAIIDDERSWTAFAANVGRDRLERRQTLEARMRWVGTIALVLIMAVAAFLAVRYFGQRAAWWSSLMPGHHVTANADASVVNTAAHPAK